LEEFLEMTSSLNDETRVKILKFLDTNGRSCVCEIVDSFDMIQSRLSRHLKILKDANFLIVEKEKKMSFYSINPNLSPIQKELLSHICSLDIKLPPKKCMECNNG
jgi:ArsR family transcriptional regulator